MKYTDVVINETIMGSRDDLAQKRPLGPPLLSEKSSNCHRLLRLEHSDRPPTPTKTRNQYVPRNTLIRIPEILVNMPS
ncbi:hypothetical protein N7493_000393 [Penicillium malachiteum]|uniref:Uncharacterized protein n=1 Tax=Penicillium malachiteum TaxID=1324776 RepID=A0AAD6HW88_9EURO|nr:hypothetical protein N7493_000393 [Penicillium malachiteum]